MVRNEFWGRNDVEVHAYAITQDWNALVEYPVDRRRFPASNLGQSPWESRH